MKNGSDGAARKSPLLVADIGGSVRYLVVCFFFAATALFVGCCAAVALSGYGACAADCSWKLIATGFISATSFSFVGAVTLVPGRWLTAAFISGPLALGLLLCFCEQEMLRALAMSACIAGAFIGALFQLLISHR